MLSDLFDIVVMLFNLLKRIMPAKSNSPKTLFKLSSSSSDLPGDNVFHSWANVLIDKRGRLYVEENSIMYSAHSLTHSSGRTTVRKAVSFEELPALIAESCNPAAAKYSGMNRKNWRKYIKEPKAVKIASKYPIVAFGRYQWYVLEQIMAS